MAKWITVAIRAAIDKKQPMYWIGSSDSWQLELRAVTAVNENGTTRTRKLTTCDRDYDIQDLSLDIARAGGLIDLGAVAELLAARAEEWEQLTSRQRVPADMEPETC